MSDEMRRIYITYTQTNAKPKGYYCCQLKPIQIGCKKCVEGHLVNSEKGYYYYFVRDTVPYDDLPYIRLIISRLMELHNQSSEEYYVAPADNAG